MKKHLAIVVLCACSGGGGEGGPADLAPADPVPQADASVETDLAGEEGAKAGESFYRVEALFDDGRQMTFGRDLAGRPGVYAFGSTHIAPAVSFAMTDTLYDPYVTVTFNLGIVVGSELYPVQCPGTGAYAFGTGLPPEMDLHANNLQFRSRLPDSQGTFEVTQWSATEGGVVAGRVRGRLDFIGEAAHWADVDAEFRFVLPPRAAAGRDAMPDGRR